MIRRKFNRPFIEKFGKSSGIYIIVYEEYKTMPPNYTGTSSSGYISYNNYYSTGSYYSGGGALMEGSWSVVDVKKTLRPDYFVYTLQRSGVTKDFLISDSGKIDGGTLPACQMSLPDEYEVFDDLQEDSGASYNYTWSSTKFV